MNKPSWVFSHLDIRVLFGYIFIVYETVNEPIFTLVAFTSKGMQPKKFIWRNRHYLITSVNFMHKSKEGNDLLTHFAVTSGGETYKITFNASRLYWVLDEIYT